MKNRKKHIHVSGRHCQKTAEGENNSFSIHCPRSKQNCVFMEFTFFPAFGGGVLDHKTAKNLI